MQKFTGDKMQEEDGLKSFIREFERHAKLSKWSEEEKRLRFELQLGGRALRMYESLGDEDRRTYESAKEALRKVLQPVKLDSYAQSLFNDRKQKSGEPVSDYAEALQRLFTGGFQNYSMDNKLRNRLLLGQFQQGLLLKWKKHLKFPLESFLDAVHQARIAEAVEAQLLDCRENKTKGKQGKPQSSSPLQVETPRQPATEVSPATGSSEVEDNTKPKGRKSKPWIKCYRCWGKGHYRSDCPVAEEQLATTKVQNGGRDQGQTNAVSIQERELRVPKEIDCRRPVTRVRLGSYEVDALLDTGSAVNIVSEATFKRIDADSVKMQVPTLKLIDFNKQEIPVIAQAQVTVAVGETELSLPMFVHDQMDLPCLLGFEASVALGLIEVKPGVELRETTQDVAAVAVKLVESCRLLPDHAAWARVKIDGKWTANQLLTVQQANTGSDEADTVVEDALLEPDVNGRARILLTNVSGKPVELKKSAVVGRVEAAEIVGLEAPSDSEMPVQEEKGREERQRKLRAQLDFPGVRMSEREVETLKEFVSRFDSVFAVDDEQRWRSM